MSETTQKAVAVIPPVHTVGERILGMKSYDGWRSLYPIFRLGVLCGFVGVKSGFGNSWEFYPLKLASEGARIQWWGAQPDTNNGTHAATKARAVESMEWSMKELGRKYPTIDELMAVRNAEYAAELALAKKMLDSMRDAKVTLVRQIGAFDRALHTAAVMEPAEWKDLGAIRLKLTNEVAQREGGILNQEAHVAKLELRNGSQSGS